MNMAKDSFIFYREWLPLVNTLPDASRLKFYDMLSAYHSGEIPSTGDPHLDGVVQFVFKKVEKNNLSYEKKCEKASISASMRWDANAYERTETHTNAMPSDANVKNAMLNDNDNDNVLSLSPTPSSAQPPKGRKKTKIETTKEQAILHYKTESEIAIQVAPAEGEKYANLGREICGMKTTECPNGMVKTVMRLPEQLTFEQYKRLCQKFGSHDAVREMLLAMHNDFDRYGLDKQQSVSLIAQKWFTNGKKRDAKGGFTTATSLPSAPSKKEYKA